MESFSTKQSQSLRNSIRDGYDIAHVYDGFYLMLNIDEDRVERMKKNLYEIIGPSGEKYLYSGCTYRFMGTEELRLIVQEIQQGLRTPYTCVKGKQQ